MISVLLAERIHVWIGTGPFAGSLVHLIALHTVRTTVREDARRIGKVINRVEYLGLQRHFVVDMLAKAHLRYFPIFL
jgi:hypothetical protein